MITICFRLKCNCWIEFGHNALSVMFIFYSTWLLNIWWNYANLVLELLNQMFVWLLIWSKAQKQKQNQNIQNLLFQCESPFANCKFLLTFWHKLIHFTWNISFFMRFHIDLDFNKENGNVELDFHQNVIFITNSSWNTWINYVAYVCMIANKKKKIKLFTEVWIMIDRYAKYFSFFFF